MQLPCSYIIYKMQHVACNQMCHSATYEISSTSDLPPNFDLCLSHLFAGLPLTLTVLILTGNLFVSVLSIYSEKPSLLPVKSPVLASTFLILPFIHLLLSPFLQCPHSSFFTPPPCHHGAQIRTAGVFTVSPPCFSKLDSIGFIPLWILIKLFPNTFIVHTVYH